MKPEVRKKALSAVMRLFHKAAIKSELEDDEDDKIKKPGKKPMKKAEPDALSDIADGVLTNNE